MTLPVSVTHFAAGCANQFGIKLPRCTDVSTRDPIWTAVNAAIGVAAAICVLFVTIGGFRYIISSGDPQNISKAKNTIIYAVIGLVVCITAYGIVSLVIGKIK